jgi:hypothetical protein
MNYTIPKTAERLDNGATVLGKFWACGTQRWVILAVWNKGLEQEPEYVTWLANEDVKPYWGKYYATLTAAMESFTTRIAEQMQ